MSFVRPLVNHGGRNLPEPMRVGVGYLANPQQQAVSADAATTLTTADILGGLIIRSGATADRIDTTPTAVLLLAALEGMDIGDVFTFKVSNQVAFAITLAGGVDVTASGNLVVAANGNKEFLLEKTSATEMNLIGL